MKQKLICTACGHDLTNKNFNRVWDEILQKSVPVCADTYTCEAKVIKKNNRRMKALEDYRKEHIG